MCTGFPVQQYQDDRLGLVLAFWGVGLHLGRPLISQIDYKAHGKIVGSVLNHVTVGRWASGQGSLSNAIIYTCMQYIYVCVPLSCLDDM